MRSVVRGAPKETGEKGNKKEKDEILHGAPGMISRRIKIIGSEILRQPRRVTTSRGDRGQDDEW